MASERHIVYMTVEDTSDHTRIRRNWAKATAAGGLVGQIFYSNLFEVAPAARAMFPDVIDDQSRKLMQTLNWIIDHLDEPDRLVPEAEALALRHVRYGVGAEHYPLVGEALLATLRQGLGEDFTAEDEEAWTRVYGVLSGIMISAAYPKS